MRRYNIVCVTVLNLNVRLEWPRSDPAVDALVGPCSYPPVPAAVPLGKTIKGEIRSRIAWVKSIERINIFEQNSEHFEVNWIKRYEILNFLNFHRNISWKVNVNMQMSELMMSSPHNYFPYILFTEIMQKLNAESTLKKCRIMCGVIYFDMGICFYMFEKKIIQLSKFHIQITWKIMRRWNHQLTHLHHNYCSRNVSLKITKMQNFISSLFSIWFTSNCHCSVRNVLFFLWVLNLDPTFSFNVESDMVGWG